MQYCRVENANDLLLEDHKRIQSLITDYLVYLKVDRALSHATIRAHYSTIHFFYTMNDVLDLNWSKVRKVMGEEGKRAEDRPYKTEEIARMLEIYYHISHQEIMTHGANIEKNSKEKEEIHEMYEGDIAD